MQYRTSQEALVARCVDWTLVERRLAKYGALARAYPVSLLEARATSPPYFCHYAAWRLGTWKDEALLARFDSLLATAESIPGWHKERSLLEGGDFADFWSLYWQLQVAEYLLERCDQLSWSGSGPDLTALTPRGPAFVECFVYRKTFGVEAYLEEVAGAVFPSVHVTRDICLPFPRPTDNELSEELSMLLRPLLDESTFSWQKSSVANRYPVVLSQSSLSSLKVVLDGPSDDAYDPVVGSTSTGDPDAYLRVAVGEAVAAKQGKNSLATHRPNIVLANFLLSRDAQAALNRAAILSLEFPPIELPSDIDAFALSVLGINRVLEPASFLLTAGLQTHPALEFILN